MRGINPSERSYHMPLIMADGSVLDPNDPKAIEAAVPSTGELILGEMPNPESMEKSRVEPEPASVDPGPALLVGDALEPTSAQALVKAADKSMAPAGEEPENGERLCKDEPENKAGPGKLFTEGELRERVAQREPGEAEQALRDQTAKSLTTEGLGQLEELTKAGPHKYTSRKRVGDKWVYTYAESTKGKPTKSWPKGSLGEGPPKKEHKLQYDDSPFSQMVEATDSLIDQLEKLKHPNVANMRGLLARVPISKFYRKPPIQYRRSPGLDPAGPPSPQEIEMAFYEAKVQRNIYSQKREEEARVGRATASKPSKKEAPLSHEHGETRHFGAGDSYHKMLSGQRVEGPSNALYLRLGSIHPQLRDPARSSLPQRAMVEIKAYSGDYTQNDHHIAAAWHHFQAEQHDRGEGIRIAHRAMAETHEKLAAKPSEKVEGQQQLFRSRVPDSLDDFLAKSEMTEEELVMSRVENIAAATSLEDMLEKAGGPYIGPKGGKWADAAHTQPWVEGDKGHVSVSSAVEKKHGAIERDLAQAHNEFTSHMEEGSRLGYAKQGLFPSPEASAHKDKAQKLWETRDVLHTKLQKLKGAKAALSEWSPEGDQQKPNVTHAKTVLREFETEKSMDKINSLDDFLAKAEQTMPEGGPNENLATRHTEDGMGLEGAPKPSGSSDSAASPAIDNPKPSKDKLSEDDAEDEKQMKEHKKPIEKGATVVKSLGNSATGYSSEHAAQLTAHEDAVSRSRLAKGVADLRPELGAPQPMAASAQLEKAQQFETFGGMVQVSNASDLACERLQKSEGFWHGEAPGVTPAQAPIHQNKQCSCGAFYKSYLTACPNCSAGAVVSRVLPVEVGGPLLEKSEGFIGLRPRRQAPDIYIPDRTDSD